MRHWAVIVEQGKGNFLAFVTDLPGCGATGTTRREVEANIAKAIKWHLEAMTKAGEEIHVPEVAG